MKYRKILIKYNAYLKRSYISQSWKYKKLYFHCSENISCISRVKLDVLCFVHWLSLAHFRISNACNFLISGQKHKVWVFIFLVRSQGIFWWLNCRDLLKFSLSQLLLLWFQFWSTWHIMQRHHQYTTARVFVLRIRVSCAFPTHCTCVEFKLRMKRESTYFEIHEYSLAAL